MDLKKRGQITIFIILGIVLLLVLSFIFYYYNIVRQTYVPEGDSSADSMQVYIQQCIESLSMDGAYHIALHGGYEYSPSFLGWKGYSFTYKYESGMPVLITRDELESNYENYIRSRLPICVNNFEFYRSKGMDVDAGSPDVDVQIFDEKILVDVTYPVTAYEGNQIFHLKDFQTVEVDARLGLLHDTAEKLIYFLASDPDYLPISKIDDLAVSNDIRIFYDVKDKSIAFVFRDENSEFPAKYRKYGDYEYVFAAKYD